MLDTRLSNRLKKSDIAGCFIPSLSAMEDLVKFLNKANIMRRGKQIVAILEMMLDLEKMTKVIKGPVLADLSLKKKVPKQYQLLWEIRRRIALLNRELANYQFIPTADILAGGDGGASQWFAYWRRDSREKPEHGLRIMASEALELILRLTQAGDLNRLRHCSQCQMWLYAKFRHQNFCSAQCQQKSYTQTEEWKAHRRKYMRSYYRKNFGGIRTKQFKKG
jgi:hypothetical protein